MHLKSLIYPISLGLTDLQWLSHMWNGVVVRDALVPVMAGGLGTSHDWSPSPTGSQCDWVPSRTELMHTEWLFIMYLYRCIFRYN